MKKALILLSVALIIFACLLSGCSRSSGEAKYTFSSPEDMVTHDLRDPYLFAPCEIVQESESESEKEVVHTISPEQIAQDNDSRDKSTMNLHMASDVPHEGTVPLGAKVGFGFNGYGDACTILTDTMEYRFSQDETVYLIVHSTVWVDTQRNLDVGLCCLETGKCYGYTLSLGYAVNQVLEFPNLPAGNYRFYAASDSDDPVPQGAIIFQISKNAP